MIRVVYAHTTTYPSQRRTCQPDRCTTGRFDGGILSSSRHLHLLGFGGGHRRDELKWPALDGFPDNAFANATRANGDGFRRTVHRRDLDRLQVGSELAPTDAGNFRTDAAQVFGLSARFDLISHLGMFAANPTRLCHCSTSYFPGTLDWTEKPQIITASGFPATPPHPGYRSIEHIMRPSKL